MMRVRMLVGGVLVVAAFAAITLAVVLATGPVITNAAASCLPPTTQPVSFAGEPPLVQYYLAAAGRYRLGADGYAHLAAINKVETAFGTNLSTSSAGAVGWMQFEPATFQKYGVAVSNPGGRPDPNDPQDGIFSAANYLHASGAPGQWTQAIFAYNHAGWYVTTVAQLAAGYTGPTGLQKLSADIATAWGGHQPSLPPPAQAAVLTGPATPPQPAVLTQPAAVSPAPASCACPTGQPTAVALPVAGIDRHGAAGFTPEAGTNFTVNLEPNLAQRLDLLGRRLHVAIYGISGYRTPAHSVEVGGFADDPHTRGAAADIGVGGSSRPSAAQISNLQLASVGLARPFDPRDDPANPEVNHVQIINADGTLLNVDAQPPIPTPGQAPANPTPTPPPIPGAATATPISTPVGAGAPTSSGGCSPTTTGAATTPGQKAVILPDGTAEAPTEAPAVVQAMIAAGNRIDHFPYSYGGAHGAPAQTMSQSNPDPAAVPGSEENGGPGYDCSSATSYVLWGGGLGQSLLGGGVDVSGDLESVGLPGPGRWVTIYANADHAYIELAGIYIDTAAGIGHPPNPPSTGPRWTPVGTGPAGFIVRHPAGL